MTQLLSRYQNAVGGVTHSSPGTLIQIPYRDSLANGELKCIGFTTQSGVIKRLYFILPMFWYSDSGVGVSLPANGTYTYTSSVFSQFDFVDDGSISDFYIGVYPQSGSGSSGMNIEIAAPNTGTSWTFYAYVDIPKEE